MATDLKSDGKPAPKKRTSGKANADTAPGTTADTAISTTITGTAAIVIPEHREDTQVPYRFTEAEMITMGTALRQKLNEIDALENQKKAAMTDFRLRIQNAGNEAKLLRNKLDSGEETRPMRVAVDFDSKRGIKRYLHPETGEFLSEAPMQPADYQLPMFQEQDLKSANPPADSGTQPAPQEQEQPAAESKPAKRTGKGSPIGETNLGDAIGQAAAQQSAAPLILDIDKDDWDRTALVKAYKKAARLAGWTEAQISTLHDVLKECDSTQAIISTLRPYVAGENPNPGTEPQSPATTGVSNTEEVPL